jgi:CIC family chloride channel protein
MVACGAAAGVSATFNAPIAGVVFALELILRDFEAEAFGVVVLASVVANVIGRAAFGDAPFLALPPFHLVSLWEYLLYAGLGLVAAFAGIAFIRVLYGVEDLVDGLWRGPEWLRPGVGGLALGMLLLALPQMYGVGYPVLEQAILGFYGAAFLLLLLAGKIVATSLTIGIGGSGGVFAPSLFMGAMLGTAYGEIVGRFLPSIAGPAGAYGLVGMGAVFAAAARAPMTAVIILFELTGQYQIILPLMFAIVLAAFIANLLSEDTIYTLKLRRRGIDLMRARRPDPIAGLRVRDAMHPVPESLSPDLDVAAAVTRFTATTAQALPVGDADGAYRGIVTLRRLEGALSDSEAGQTVGQLAEQAPTLTPDLPLHEAVEALVHSTTPGLPVIAADRQRVVGWLTRRDILKAYRDRLGGAGLKRARATGPIRE